MRASCHVIDRFRGLYRLAAKSVPLLLTGEKQGVFEKAEPALCLGLSLVPGNDLGIAELLGLNIASEHKTRVILLGVLDAFDVGSHTGVELPLGGFDRGLGSGPTFGGVAFMLKQLARFALMILPLFAECGQGLVGQLRCLKTLCLSMKQLLCDGLMFSFLGFVERSLGAPGRRLRPDHQPALLDAKVA